MASINSSGGTATGNSGSVSYSIGQVVYTYVNDTGYSIEQGIQHAEIPQDDTEEENNLPEDIDGEGEADIIPETPEVHVLIYPNPTTDYVNVATEGLLFENQNNFYRLFNYQGQLLMEKNISEDTTKIHLDHLSASMYILRVFVNNSLYKTFKILKK
ncbi:T9SS type A sorting domain-containing protein [Mariniflexile gromovii]|uniref:T9SS type A sorting domain-containing protein n=1 Tax=Mariniflexile gromovii TaxID=362523 RepID=A0ABS4BSX7_9FLAO|nr:T9SS type A sorting domain-containing protein [Mariniflexile gromovii]MBP0903707.1 T9SS type A sorting domain-containing protein [Mariniflexile gromovii]